MSALCNRGYNDETGGLDGEKKERCGSAVGLLTGLSGVALGLAGSIFWGYSWNKTTRGDRGFRRGRSVGSIGHGNGTDREDCHRCLAADLGMRLGY